MTDKPTTTEALPERVWIERMSDGELALCPSVYAQGEYVRVSSTPTELGAEAQERLLLINDIRAFFSWRVGPDSKGKHHDVPDAAIRAALRLCDAAALSTPQPTLQAPSLTMTDGDFKRFVETICEDPDERKRLHEYWVQQNANGLQQAIECVRGLRDEWRSVLRKAVVKDPHGEPVAEGYYTEAANQIITALSALAASTEETSNGR